MSECRAKAPPRLSLSGAEWKLWLAAVLGAAYTLSWASFERPAPPSAGPEARRPRTAQASPGDVRATRPARVRTRSS
jgi:hypothetical protein